MVSYDEIIENLLKDFEEHNQNISCDKLSEYPKNKFLTIKAKYLLKYDIRISTESIVCHTDTINYEIGFLYIII